MEYEAKGRPKVEFNVTGLEVGTYELKFLAENSNQIKELIFTILVTPCLWINTEEIFIDIGSAPIHQIGQFSFT